MSADRRRQRRNPTSQPVNINVFSDFRDFSASAPSASLRFILVVTIFPI